MEQMNNRFDGLALQPQRQSQRILVVLNIGGTLSERIIASRLYASIPPHYHLGEWAQWAVWDRPGKEEFLDWLFANFDVAVWSSAKQKRANKFVIATFDKQQQRKLVFTWAQGECNVVQLNVNEPPLITKSLNMILQGFPEYTANKVILIDNSLESFAEDARLNCIVPKPWTRTETKDYALTPCGSLRNFFRCLLRAQAHDANLNVRQFIEYHPVQGFELAAQAYEQVLVLASIRPEASSKWKRVPKELRVRMVFEMLTGKLTF